MPHCGIGTFGASRAPYCVGMVIDSNDTPLHERQAVCDGCGIRVPLTGAGLVEDGGVLCPACADLDVQTDGSAISIV